MFAVGAAISDKRLSSGDQILEVNGVSMEDKSQEEAVAILRNMKRGSTVSLLVSRKDLTTPNDHLLPRQLVIQPSSTLPILLSAVSSNSTGGSDIDHTSDNSSGSGSGNNVGLAGSTSTNGFRSTTSV